MTGEPPFRLNLLLFPFCSVCPAVQLTDLIAAAGKPSYFYYFAHLQGSDGKPAPDYPFYLIHA